MAENTDNQPATKADLKELATKADLRELAQATKADLKELAQITKADLDTGLKLAKSELRSEMQDMKTELKGDIAGLRTELKGDIADVRSELAATRTDLKELEQKLGLKIGSVETTVNTLAIELAKTQADVRQIKEDMVTKTSFRDEISRVMSALDAFAAQALSYRNHDDIRGGKIMEHESKLKNHDERLVLLENPKQ